jgi:hypothetical protein
VAQATPEAARSHYALSALLAARAVREAQKALTQGLGQVARVVTLHQVTQAQRSELAVAQMLAEQRIEADTQAILQTLAFTTAPDATQAMVASLDDPTGWEFDRLIASLVQDAGRAAEQVAVTVRKDIGWVRHLNLPSCSRCAVLAGRIYRYSDGFMRHPGDDCITIPVRAGDDRMVVDPVDLARQGQVRGLSKADMKAIDDGADFNQIVNVRSKKAGLTVAGEVLARAGRPTPAGIYRRAKSRSEAIELLARYGYIR